MIDVRREPLSRLLDDATYAAGEIVAEGFPMMTAAAFVLMFCRTHGCQADDRVTRIEFEYAD